MKGKKFKLHHEQKLFLFAWGDCYQTRNTPASDHTSAGQTIIADVVNVGSIRRSSYMTAVT
jgi:hypothetical protein